MRFLLLFVLFVAVIEAFEERLYIQPLEDGKKAFHFQFTQRARLGGDKHFGGFPRVISQLVQEFDIKELSVSMTQGRWAYHRWGSIPFVVSMPLTGAQVWTIMNSSYVIISI